MLNYHFPYIFKSWCFISMRFKIKSNIAGSKCTLIFIWIIAGRFFKGCKNLQSVSNVWEYTFSHILPAMVFKILASPTSENWQSHCYFNFVFLRKDKAFFSCFLFLFYWFGFVLLKRASSNPLLNFWPFWNQNSLYIIEINPLASKLQIIFHI